MKYIIFDMDGVLFDTEALTLRCWLEVTKPYGMKDVRETFISCIGTNEDLTRQIFRKKYGDEYPIKEIKEQEEELLMNTIRTEGPILKPYSEETLSYLSSNGYILTLASSTDVDDVKTELKLSGYEKYFKHVIGGDMVSHGKPDPEIFLKACQLMGCDPGETFVIEDSYNGVRAAHAAGAHPIMVPDMLPATDEMYELADTVVSNLREALAYIKVH